MFKRPLDCHKKSVVVVLNLCLRCVIAPIAVSEDWESCDGTSESSGWNYCIDSQEFGRKLPIASHVIRQVEITPW